MQVKTIIDAYPYIHKLSLRELPHKIAFDLLELLLILEPVMKYYTGEREKAIKRYAVLKEGDLIIPQEAVKSFQADLESIVALEKEVEFTPIRLQKDMIRGQTFTPAELLGARPFILYETLENKEE